MKIIDLSQPVYNDAPNCPAHPPVKVELEEHTDGGPASWQMEFLDFAGHTGSHLDAPRHKLAGAPTIDQLPLETFIGEALLADLRYLTPTTAMTPQHLERALPTDVRGRIVLLCTGWGDKRAKSDEWLYQSPFVSPAAATWLVERGVRAIGIDHFSIGGTREPDNARTHEILLGAGMWIVEELHFPDEVWELSQPVQFMALPMHLRGASGAPCRPVIVVED
jgi:arylformamidase